MSQLLQDLGVLAIKLDDLWNWVQGYFGEDFVPGQLTDLIKELYEELTILRESALDPPSTSGSPHRHGSSSPDSAGSGHR
jgi:hypothetical protein